jgi:hypothetical protein
MKRKLLFFLILLGIIGLVIGLVKLISDRSPKQGVLKINSDPTSDIFLNNRHLGQSPYEDKVDEGEYEIKLVPQSTTQAMASWQGKVKISKNLLTYVNSSLAMSDFQSAVDILWLDKITSSLSEIDVVTQPDGAQVTLDGTVKGNTPLTMPNIAPGDHNVSIDSPGFTSRSVKVKTTAGYKLVLSTKLALSDTNMLPEDASMSAIATSSASLTPIPTSKIKITPTVKITLTPTLNPTVTVISPTTKVTSTPIITSEVTPTVAAGGELNPTKPYLTIKDTPTGFLRVRSEGSSAGTEVSRVNPGEKYSILDNKDGWYQIKYNGTDTGWVSGTYVTVVQ